MKYKKLILTAVILFWSFSSILPSGAVVLGDIDNDGKVGLKESVYALQTASGIAGEYTVTVVFSWKGEWEAGQSYAIGDVAYLDGTSYICIADHLADTSNTPPFQDVWNILARKGDAAALSVGAGLLKDGDTVSIQVGSGLAVTENGIGLETGYADGSIYDNRFVTKLNDAMNLARLVNTPCPCDESVSGRIFLASNWKLCVCNGNGWVETSDGETPCTALNIDNDGDGFSEADGDCDDSDNTVYPGHPELCDGKDNDCDGNIDEDFTQLGQPCEEYTWFDATWVCAPNGEGVICEGYQLIGEPCDGIDNNMDGATDEGYNVGASCGVGACAGTGIIACDSSGNGTVCEGETGAGPELCDGIDNDCDGITDEDFNIGAPCGPCNDGQIACDPSGAASCVGASEPVELCVGIDNDCDGMTDEEAFCEQGECDGAGGCI